MMTIAIAFAIINNVNIKPEKVRFHSLMRSHLIKIFESNIIEYFPQDLIILNYNLCPIIICESFYISCSCKLRAAIRRRT